MDTSHYKARFPVENYNLAVTLNSGQAFRWELHDGAWEGIVGGRWIKLSQEENGILAETASPVSEWGWLADYLQVDFQLESMLKTLPDDKPMRAAISACHGLRLLRQNPWECLASFILSSNKQIVHIRQIIGLICERFGKPVQGVPGSRTLYQFPDSSQIADATESELRECRMGYRARYLKETASLVESSGINLQQLPNLKIDEARTALMSLPGVGRKIADCVLLFSIGFNESFPIDVWIMRGLREHYFVDRPMSPRDLQRFVGEHFGPYAGYAQQYLFHHWRTR